MKQRAANGVSIAVFSAATFGISGAFAKPLLDAGWSPGAAVAVRVGGAALVMLIPVLWGLRGRFATLRDTAPTIAVYGITAIALCQLFYFSAVARMSVGVSLLLEYLAPVLIVVWIWVRSRHAPRRLTVVGAVTAMGGLLLVLDLAGGGSLDPIGVAFGLAAAVCLAIFFVMSARVDANLPPLVMAGGGMIVGAVVILVLGLTGIMPFRFAFGTVQLGGSPVSWLVPVAVLILVSTVASYMTGILAAQRLGSKVASFIALTEVMFAVAAAWLILGELPKPIQLVGGLLIVAGVICVRIDEFRRDSRTRGDRMPASGAGLALDHPNDVEPILIGPSASAADTRVRTAPAAGNHAADLAAEASQAQGVGNHQN